MKGKNVVGFGRLPSPRSSLYMTGNQTFFFIKIKIKDFCKKYEKEKSLNGKCQIGIILGSKIKNAFSKNYKFSHKNFLIIIFCSRTMI